jgi:hypothetical protein
MLFAVIANPHAFTPAVTIAALFSVRGLLSMRQIKRLSFTAAAHALLAPARYQLSTHILQPLGQSSLLAARQHGQLCPQKP